MSPIRRSTKMTIAVFVFKDNPFQRFYTKNGFIKIDDEIVDLGDFNLMAEIYLKNTD